MKSVKQMADELFRSAGDGSVSLSKTMKALAFLVCSYVVLLQAHRGELGLDIFLTYFGLVVGNDQLGKWQSIKREVLTQNSAETNESTGVGGKTL